MNLRRAAIAGSVTLFLGTLGFVIALRLSAYKTSQNIRDLIAAEQQWGINRTRRAEVEQVVKKYAAAKPSWCLSLCDAGIEIDSWYPAWLLDDSFIHTALGKLGIRPFSFSSSFMFSDEKLSEVHASYAVVLSDGSTRLISVGPNPTDPMENEEPRYRVTRPHLTTPGGGLTLRVRYGADINDSEWQRAFGFNLDCATRLIECKDLAEYTPEAWYDYEQQRLVDHERSPAKSLIPSR